MKVNPDASTIQFDWQDIHRRLETVRQAIAEEIEPGPAEAKKILRSRAQALARVPDEDAEAGDYIEVIEFQLGLRKILH